MEVIKEKDIPKDSVQLHLYDWKNVLMPRGSRQMESIYENIHPRLIGTYESFTDPKYGDNPDKQQLLEQMYLNLMGETYKAWQDFLRTIPPS
jgi:hypothetical protein